MPTKKTNRFLRSLILLHLLDLRDNQGLFNHLYRQYKAQLQVI